MEFTHFVRGIRKPVVGVVTQEHYSPFGALCAISISSTPLLIYSPSPDFSVTLTQKIEKLCPSDDKPSPPVPIPVSSLSLSSPPPLTFQKSIFISRSQDASEAADLVHTELSSLAATFMGTPGVASLNEIDLCGVFVPIISDGYKASDTCMEEMDRARRTGKFIVPVLGEANFFRLFSFIQLTPCFLFSKEKLKTDFLIHSKVDWLGCIGNCRCPILRIAK